MALLTTNDKELLENLYDRYSGLVWHVAMEIVDESPEPLDRIIEAEECSTLRRAFRKLDEDTRQILYLRFVAELTNPEIAKALNISTQYVAVKVLRAKKALKKAMEMEEGKYGERQTF